MKEALDRGGRCCLAWLDPQKDLMPVGGYEVAHDTGRWWDAMLRLEHATGFAIPAPVEAAMLRNLQRLTDNPDGLLLNSPDVPWLREKAKINPHNLREGLLALHALVRHRRSDWAREAGRRLVAGIDRIFQDSGRLDFTRSALWGRVPFTHDPSHSEPGSPWFDGTATSGRCLEAVLLFHEETGDAAALRLADRLARHHLAASVSPDGAMRPEIVDPANVGHNHSYCGTLRGLLLYGLMTGRREYVEAVAATYRRALPQQTITESGWTPHDLGKLRFPNGDGDPVGEHGSCADVIHLALWLGLRAGQPELLDDAERLVRARIFPSQIVNPADPRLDGAWGVYGHPYSRGAILDVFAAVIHTLAALYESVVTRGTEGTCSLNLHFDHDGPLATVRVTRSGARRRVVVTPKVAAAWQLRVPRWTPPGSVRLACAGAALPLERKGVFAVTPHACAPGQALELEFDLPRRQSTEIMPVSGHRYALTWLGDEVASCSPAVEIYPPGP